MNRPRAGIPDTPPDRSSVANDFQRPVMIMSIGPSHRAV
jgi:hypothetical protein